MYPIYIINLVDIVTIVDITARLYSLGGDPTLHGRRVVIGATSTFLISRSHFDHLSI